MKVCNKCNQEKQFSDFYKKLSSKDGYNTQCISCRKEYNIKNKESIQNYYLENKENHQNNSKRYYNNNKEKVIQNSIYFQNNNPELKKSYYNKWAKNNREYFKKWRQNQWDNNPNFRLRITLGNRLNECLKKSKTNKDSNIIELLGCSLDKLKTFLESKFTPEMNWDNHGKVWEIDHIKPCASFNLTDIKQQQECFHYSNLQPLFKTTEISESFGYKNHVGNRNKSSNQL
jgi:hypothetical protein